MKLNFKNIPFLIVILLCSCQNNSQEKKISNNNVEAIDSTQVTPSSEPVLNDNESKDSVIDAFLQRFDTVLTNNGQSYQVTIRRLNSEIALLKVESQGRTALIDTVHPSAIAYFEYPDFDLDGHVDILFDYIGNNPTYSLFLFDTTTNNFIKIENYSRFPGALHLHSDSNYYYSYHRAGCADMIWVSDLFVIEDFKIIHLGHIDGEGCDFDIENNPRKIKIYKVINNDTHNRKLIDELPYEKHITEFENKWDFIENYWNKNYLKFKSK